MSAIFILRVTEVWNLPGRPFPVVWGALEVGEVQVGSEVEVVREDGSSVHGVVEGIELVGATKKIHSDRMIGMMVSGDAADAVREGVTVRSLR
ncbi:MAG TPA: hypothetical protein VFP54_04935 [Acidimicrobiales bacterium]|nr:hypothetical protein [Acidimicrobiales bacterium]